MKTMQRVAVLLCVVFGCAIADFRDDALNLHNKYRAKHHAPALDLSDELNDYAENWAETMADNNDFNHSGGKHGENIYKSGDTSLSDSDAVLQATKLWYDEVSKYDYNHPGFGMHTGHFTQVVWKNTKHMGIGVGRSDDAVYVCGSYDPPGNYKGQFPENVLKP